MQDDINDEGRVPLFPKWSYWYTLVIGFLILLIAFFNFLTKHFS